SRAPRPWDQSPMDARGRSANVALLALRQPDATVSVREGAPMVESFARIAGPLQAALGAVTAASPEAAAALGAGSGASGLNVLSGAALSVLGFKGSENAQRSGSQILGGANLVVGVLGLLGIDQIAGVPMNAAILGNVISIGIGIWGLVAGFIRG